MVGGTTSCRGTQLGVILTPGFSLLSPKIIMQFTFRNYFAVQKDGPSLHDIS
jgi:hypothetical protein